ncbi:hypothetical protein [Streptomyces sp. NPDC058291]|uniref:hypothetical protein n=1 Tax=Streptomyces sp. NPDC058291 TaxID=3346427 RepID=UPI0036E50D38
MTGQLFRVCGWDCTHAGDARRGRRVRSYERRGLLAEPARYDIIGTLACLTGWP